MAKRNKKLDVGAACGVAWGDTRASWTRAQAELVERFRPLYLAEVERFAETLRRQFEAGKYRGITDDDLDHEMRHRRWLAPLWRLERLCREHFVGEEEAEVTAALIIRCSPSAPLVALDTETSAEIVSVRRAGDACTWDVIAIARARGWYVPREDECPSVSETAWALAAEARS